MNSKEMKELKELLDLLKERGVSDSSWSVESRRFA